MLLIGINGFSQGVTTIKKAESLKLLPGKKYAYVEPAIDTNSLVYVATLQGKDRIRSANIENIYYVIREKANKLGANCYIFRYFNIDQANDEVTLILDSYYATDSLLAVNTANHENNVVYIFGNEKGNDNAMTYYFNGVSREIKSGTFHKIVLKKGEEIKLNKGGATGAFVSLSWKQDNKPVFYSLSGFGLNMVDTKPGMGENHNGISFHSGAINQIENISLGYLMTLLLKPGE